MSELYVYCVKYHVLFCHVPYKFLNSADINGTSVQNIKISNTMEKIIDLMQLWRSVSLSDYQDALQVFAVVSIMILVKYAGSSNQTEQ